MRTSLTFAVAVWVTLTTVHAQQPPAPPYEIVSVNDGGVEGDKPSSPDDLSDDGRFVVFRSTASNLIAGTSANCGGTFCEDVYVRDRVARTTTRVSVASDGTAANGASTAARMSADGRVVAFASVATNLVPGDTNGAGDIFVRDIVADTTTRVSVSTSSAQADGGSGFPLISRDGRLVVFSSTATNLVAPTGDVLCGAGFPLFQPRPCSNVFVHDWLTGATRRISSTPTGGSANGDSSVSSVSEDGCLIAYASSASNITDNDDDGLVNNFVFDCLTGRTTRETTRSSSDGQLSADGRWLYFTAYMGPNVAPGVPGGPVATLLLDRRTREETVIGVVAQPGSSSPLFVSVDGRTLAETNSYRVVSGVVFRDRVAGFSSSSRLGGLCATRAGLSVTPDGAFAATSLCDGMFVKPAQVVLIRLDSDGDSMSDAYEQTYGLDPTDAADAQNDADGDGLTNAQEFMAGSHPRGLFRRYLAEGVTGGGFTTRFNLFNPGSAPGVALLTFVDPLGRENRQAWGASPRFNMSLTLPGDRPPPGLANSAFSTIVESDVDVVVTRTVDWGADRHAEGAVDSATTWHFAEGATHSGFQLFYLLVNPGDVPVSVTARWLRPAAAPFETTYAVAPHSRHTVWANADDPRLTGTDVAVSFEASAPIVAERTMYRADAGGAFTAGHGAAGVTAPALSWAFAEGATGDLFDLFLLIGNPGATAADVDVEYLLPDGTGVTRRYTVAAGSRRTVWVDYEDPALLSTSVAMTLTSNNGVPITAERAMWWPGPTGNTWHATHVSAGATTAGSRWATTGGIVRSAAGGPYWKTYVLISNVSTQPAEVRVTVFQPLGLPSETLHAMPALSRMTISLLEDRQSFNELPVSTLVESVGQNPADLLVEQSVYTIDKDGTWRGGTNSPARRLP